MYTVRGRHRSRGGPRVGGRPRGRGVRGFVNKFFILLTKPRSPLPLGLPFTLGLCGVLLTNFQIY